MVHAGWSVMFLSYGIFLFKLASIATYKAMNDHAWYNNSFHVAIAY